MTTYPKTFVLNLLLAIYMLQFTKQSKGKAEPDHKVLDIPNLNNITNDMILLSRTFSRKFGLCACSKTHDFVKVLKYNSLNIITEHMMILQVNLNVD